MARSTTPLILALGAILLTPTLAVAADRYGAERAVEAQGGQAYASCHTGQIVERDERREGADCYYPVDPREGEVYGERRETGGGLYAGPPPEDHGYDDRYEDEYGEGYERESGYRYADERRYEEGYRYEAGYDERWTEEDERWDRQDEAYAYRAEKRRHKTCEPRFDERGRAVETCGEVRLSDSFFWGGGGVGPEYIDAGGGGGGVVYAGAGASASASASAQASVGVSIRIGGGKRGHGGGKPGHPPKGGGCCKKH